MSKGSLTVRQRISPSIVLLGALVAAGILGLAGARVAAGAPAGPTVSFTTAAPASPVHGVLDLAGTAQAPAGIAKVELRVGNGPYMAVTGTTSWSFSLDTAAYADGPHDLKARVTDSTGAQSWADLNVIFQNTTGDPTPRVSITSPSSLTKLKQTVLVRGRASAPFGVAKVEVRVDNGVYQPATGLGTWSFKLDTLAQVDGGHTLYARVTDQTGAQTVAHRAIKISNHVGQIYWGALVSGHLYGYGDPPGDMRGVRVFEQHAGKKVSMLAYGTNWGSPHPNFPKGGMNAIRDHGSIPFFSWGSKGPGPGTEQSKYKLSNIINGKFDGYIRKFALAAKAWGHPFFLRFDWEMNLIGTFPWVETVNGNSRGQFVKMWRHVHNIFTQVGANNATWVWCPNAEYTGSSKPLSQLYPGNAYVDWTCIDGYNWGVRKNVWQTFTQVIGPTYKNILANVAPSKPVMIGETGSSEYGGSKAAWIKDTLAVEVPHVFRRVKAFIWFNVHDKADWQIETSRKAEAAFHAAIGSRHYAGADFATLPGTKIRPLTP